MTWRDEVKAFAERAKLSAIWSIDTEYQTMDLRGERIKAVWCVCGVELLSGEEIKVWTGDEPGDCPFPVGRDDVMFIAHNATAEGQAFKVLGWPHAANVLDTMIEQRRATNLDDGDGSAKARFGSLNPNLSSARGWGLVACLKSYGLEEFIPDEKDDMRQLAIQGGPWTTKNKAALLEYCLDDCRALGPLLAELIPAIETWKKPARNYGQARVRGCASWAMSSADYHGIPIDVHAADVLMDRAPQIATKWIEEDAPGLEIYRKDGDGVLRLRHDQIAEMIEEDYDPDEWPLTDSGNYAFDSDTLRDMVEICPELRPIRDAEALRTLLQSSKLRVESDGRLRPRWNLSIQKTQRTSATGSPFALTKGLRPIVKAAPGEVLVVLDWVSQEFAIAGALSKDQHMLEAYRGEGDVYLNFARQAGMIRRRDWDKAVARGANLSATFAKERAPAKIIVLGVQFGMTEHGLAKGLKTDRAHARQLLAKHQTVYAKFHGWSRTVVDRARQDGYATTALGWILRATSNARARTIKNLPIQGSGADVMKMALLLAQDAGLPVVATVHDALGFCFPADEWEVMTRKAAALMTKAGRLAVGEPIRVDGQAVMPGERFAVEGKALTFWNRLADDLGVDPMSELLAEDQKRRIEEVLA